MEQNKNDKNLVVKESKRLLPLSGNGVSRWVLKMIAVYFSKVDLHNLNNRNVRFENGEIENILGVDRMEKDVLIKKLDEHFVLITIEDTNNPRGFIKISLFETATAYTGEDGNWLVDLSCTRTAMEYILWTINYKYNISGFHSYPKLPKLEE